jgi:hypothetical protein
MQITLRTLTNSVLTPVLCLSLAMGGALAGCKTEETPPPLPTTKPAPTPTTVTLVADEAEDAGTKEDKKKKGGVGGRPRGPLTACCAALRQNSANLPEPSKGHMSTAAAACEAANGSGTAPGAFIGTLTGLLRGAPLPPACR